MHSSHERDPCEDPRELARDGDPQDDDYGDEDDDEEDEDDDDD